MLDQLTLDLDLPFGSIHPIALAFDVPIAAQMMEISAQDIAFDGSFSVPGTNIEPLPFAKVARMAYLGHVLPD